MKSRNIIGILAVFCLAALLVNPVAAADTTPVDNSTAYYNAGLTFLSTNDFAGALVQFDKALAEDTSLIARSDTLMYLYQARAFTLIQLNRSADALETTDQGLALYPKDSKLWNNKGFALSSLGRYQEAVTAYNQAIAIDGNYTSALINKGGALYKLGDYSGSAQAYSKALETNPGNADATDGLKHAQEKAGSTLTIFAVLIAVIIVASAGAVWYMKFRKPAAGKTPGKKGKEKGKKK